MRKTSFAFYLFLWLGKAKNLQCNSGRHWVCASVAEEEQSDLPFQARGGFPHQRCLAMYNGKCSIIKVSRVL